VSLNIEFGIHNETVLNFLKKEKADVICLQELLEEEFELFKKELEFDGIFQSWSYVKSSNYKDWLGKKQGVAIFAKDIIGSGSIFYQGAEENILKPFTEYMLDEKFQKNSALVWAKIKGDGSEIFKIVTTHLPVTEKGEVTPYQLAAIDDLLDHLLELGDIVLCGDMNAPRGKESFARLAAIYKDSIPLRYTTSIDQNLHKVKGIQHMVDGLFTSSAYKASEVSLEDGLSDHMAVIAEIGKN